MVVTERVQHVLPGLNNWVSDAHLYPTMNQIDTALASMPIRRPKLGIDIDGVCADFVGACIAVWYQETGLLVDRAQLDQWSIFDCGVMDRDIVAPRVEKRGFCASLDLFPEAKPGLATIEPWADIYAVTSPWHESEWWVSERTTWLEEKLGIDHRHQIHTSAKELVRVDVFVDDRPENVAKWQVAFPEGRALLWDTPHNRKEHAGTRVKSWNEVLFQVLACIGSGSMTPPMTLH